MGALNTVYDIGFTVGTGILREDLTDLISNASPTETPMFSNFGSEPGGIRSTTHEWLEDSDAAAADNAVTDGHTFTYATETYPSRLSNWTQIIEKTLQITRTAMQVNVAGPSSLWQYKLAMKMREIANDAEYAIVNGTGNSGASGTARRMKGVLAFITTNYSTASAARDLSASLIDAQMQAIWENGASDQYWALYCGGYQKRIIAGFSTNVTRNIDASENKQINRIEVYDGPLGMIRVVLSRYVPTTNVLLIDTARWKKAFLSPFRYIDTAVTSDGKNGAINGELTLVCRVEKMNARIATLNTA